ncbi:glycosyltransferase family 39 protein [Candidatus Woesearchaeota archaeon]|nr:glycosyltransferase family 39 protein [Candidatus Woesearchaeota archaeon]
MIQNRSKRDYAIFFAMALAFILIVSKGLANAQPGDENAYYYMGKLVSEGKVPYRDFFYAHPPLHLYIIALVYNITGFNIVALKSISLLSTLASAFFIFRISKERFGSLEAIISSALFLFSYSVMFNSAFSFGIEIATMLLVIGFYCLWNRNNAAVAGIFFGLAAITRLLTLIPAFIIMAYCLASGRKKFLKFSSAFLAIFLLANGIFIASFGGSYTDPVYKFHFMKSLDSKEKFKEYSDIIKLNWILFLAGFSFLFVKDKKPIGIIMAVSLAYLLFLLALKKIFGFYLLPAFPFLAIAGGCSISGIMQSFSSNEKWKKWKVPALILLFLIFGWNLAADILFLEKVGFTGFGRGNELADFVSSHSGSNTLLFGDDSATPLLALMSGKKIAFNAIDTNNQVFETGIVDLEKTLDKLKGNDVLFIARTKHGIYSFNEARRFLNQNCAFLSQFHDEMEGDYLVYKCGR